MRIFSTLIALVIILIIGLIIVRYSLFSPTASLGFVEKVTSMSFPDGTTNVDSYDNGEFFVTTHVTLPTESISDFISTNKFYENKPTRPLLGLEMLKSPYQTIPSAATLVRESESGSHSWVAQLDPTSGDMWVTILYPDPSGDK